MATAATRKRPDTIALPAQLDILRVRNVSTTRTYTLRHDKYDPVTLAPGAETVVPLPIALVNFGNPGAVDIGRNRLREIELAHVQHYWGFYAGFMSDDEWADTYMPQIECFDMAGNRVWMVHDDPTGANRDADVAAAMDEATDPSAQLARFEALQARRAADAAAANAPQTQAQRNAMRETVPVPDADELLPRKDAPRTTRTGSGSSS